MIGGMWRTWSGGESCEPAVVERPATTAEVVAAVERAVTASRPVKAAGSGHSFTGAALTDGSQLLTDRLTGLVDADRASGRVRVRAGTTIHALSALLDEQGLALPNLGDIDAQTIAGAIATGTHGTGATLPGLAAQVTAVQLVTAAGEVLEIDAADPDLLGAARVSLGALGVVTEVELQAVPAFTLRGVDRPLALADVLDGLDEHVAAHRHFEFYVFPHADVALTRANDVAGEPPRPRGRAGAWMQDILLTNHAFHAICLAGRALPAAVPALNRFATRAAGASVRVDRSDRIFATRRLVRFTEMEYALPRAAAAPALREIKAIAERFAVGFPMEVRFAAADDVPLSTAHGRETAYVAVHVFRGMAWEPFFRAVEAVALQAGGRPHWGKRHFRSAETLAPAYPGWDAFAAVRARLDPGGVFANAYTDQVLGRAAPEIPVSSRGPRGLGPAADVTP
jgi:FAD-linked oxidoreductase